MYLLDKKYFSFTNVFKIFFISSIFYLLSSALIFRIDYQDSWVLDNLQVSYILFVICYIVVVIFENNQGSLLFMSIIARFTFLLIPNLKYVFFLGRSMDQHLQYVLSNEILKTSFVSNINDYVYFITGRYYIESPLYHLSLTTFNIMTGINLSDTFKYFPIVLNVIYPLSFYVLLKNLNIKNKHYWKFIIFLSSMPINQSITYLITGGMYVFVFLFGIFNQTIVLLNDQKRENYVLLIILVIGSTISHPIETLHFITILLSSLFVLNFFNQNKMFHLINQLFVGLIINIGWISIQQTQFIYLGNFLKSTSVSELSVTPTLSLLFNASILDTLRIFVLYYGVDLFLLFFIGIGGLFILNDLRKRKLYSDQFNYLLIYYVIILALSFVGFVFGIGFNYYGRVFRLSYFAVGILSGYLLSRVKPSQAKIIFPLLLISTVFVASIQFYSYSGLIPSASLVFDVEDDVPLVIRGEVNSIYQRKMVQEAYENIDGLIACDAVTRNQFLGLTDSSYFSEHITWYNPLDKLNNPYITEKEYEYFLIHLPGISGAFEEQATIRDSATILSAIYEWDMDIIYSNSQSFILRKR